MYGFEKGLGWLLHGIGNGFEWMRWWNDGWEYRYVVGMGK